MRRVINAALVGSVLTLIPIFILMLNSETAAAKLLKSAAATVGVPGAFVGLLLAFGRVHDVDPWVSIQANPDFTLRTTAIHDWRSWSSDLRCDSIGRMPVRQPSHQHGIGIVVTLA